MGKHKQMNDREFRKLQKKFNEQKSLYENAQVILMQNVLKFIERKDWIHLKQFCENYAK
jgi:hypothetical protein